MDQRTARHAVVAVGYVTTIAQGRRGFALWWDPDLKTDALAEAEHLDRTLIYRPRP
jgi:hypothetical protein